MDNGESSYRRFLSGDDQGMVELVRDYKDSLILYLRTYVSDLHTAEDLVQDTFLKIAVDKPRFSGRCSFKTWFFTIGRNIACDHLRKVARRKSVPLDECAGLESGEDIEIECLVDEQRRVLYRAVSRLNPEYGRVLVLSYFEGFRNEEIAKITGRSKRQVESLLYNARKALRAELERSGFRYEGL